MSQRAVSHETFTIERVYRASVERVFAAWADPAKKRRWFAEGEGALVASFESDFREGGFERTKFRFGNGSEMTNETHHHHIVENRRIVSSYSMTLGGKTISVSLMTVEVEATDAGTTLRFTEQAAFFEGGDGADRRRQGWTELLDALGTSLSND